MTTTSKGPWDYIGPEERRILGDVIAAHTIARGQRMLQSRAYGFAHVQSKVGIPKERAEAVINDAGNEGFQFF